MATAFKTTDAENAPKETQVHSAPHDWDVSRAEIYAEDRWQPIFKEMRAQAPINKIVDSDFGDYWNITTAKPIQHIEALPDLFSSEEGGITLVGKEAQAIPEEEQVRMPMFIAMDRPKHTEQRRVVAPAFTPSEMVRMTENIRSRTSEILDNLPVGKTFDWVDEVSIELTTQMLRSQLLHRVLLFAPEPLAAPAATPAAAAEARPPRPRLDALTTRLDDALKKLNSLCIATS